MRPSPSSATSAACCTPWLASRGDAGAHGLLGGGLDRQVERGLDHQVLLRLADQGAHLGVDPVDEILGALVGQGGRDPHRLGEGLRRAGPG